MEQIQPKNYLVESILVTVLCCLPFGIAGIVFASQVNTKFAIGDYEGAQLASKNAKTWTHWGFIAGLVFLIVPLIFIFLFGGLVLLGELGEF